MKPLPRLMVAPNGARKGKADHSALPITDDEVVQAAVECWAAGADGIHIHIRDANGGHLLDAGRYRALIDRLDKAVPGMYLQITSEAAGRYDGQSQRDMMRALRPAHVSVALREMVRSDGDWPEAIAFYGWAATNNVDIHHILYDPDEVRIFVDALATHKIPGNHHLLQLVQGSYADGSKGAVDLSAYLIELERANEHTFDWMLCAFGKAETASLVNAARLGGKARVGFENSLWHADGTLAADNAERIREVDAELRVALKKVRLEPKGKMRGMS